MKLKDMNDKQLMVEKSKRIDVWSACHIETNARMELVNEVNEEMVKRFLKNLKKKKK